MRFGAGSFLPGTLRDRPLRVGFALGAGVSLFPREPFPPVAVVPDVLAPRVYVVFALRPLRVGFALGSEAGLFASERNRFPR